MKGISVALRALHRGERDLAQHRCESASATARTTPVYHVAAELAGWSQEHTQRLAHAAQEYGLRLGEPRGEPPTVMRMLRGKTAEVVGRRPEPGLLLLHDLREPHLAAAGNSLYGEMLAQACACRKLRPYWSSGRSVLMDNSTETILSTYGEAIDPFSREGRG